MTTAALDMFSSRTHTSNIAVWPEYELGKELQTVEGLVAVVGEQSACTFEVHLVMSSSEA